MHADNNIFIVLARLLVAQKQAKNGIRALIEANQEPLRKAMEGVVAFQASSAAAELGKGIAALCGLLEEADRTVRAYAEGELHNELGTIGTLLVDVDRKVREIGVIFNQTMAAYPNMERDLISIRDSFLAAVECVSINSNQPWVYWGTPNYER